MFDRLVESEASGADARPRRKIFAVSFIFVALLFSVAVVASIYAANFDLNNDNFDIAELLTPVPATEPVEEQPQPQRQQNAAPAASDRIVRQVLMESAANNTLVPTSVSTNPNPYRSTDRSKFDRVDFGTTDTIGDPGPSGAPRGNGSGSGGDKFVASSSDNDVDGPTKVPPPVAPKVDKKPPAIKSEGVINGKATSLPKPVYTAAAKSVGAQGQVQVQVMIDESGKVVSAKAVSGHPMLRGEAQKAAYNAKFSTTYLSNVPVKVTGIITYNFVK